MVNSHPWFFSCVLNGALRRDRRKLTFYFVAEKRIDFRELVRELFRSVLVSLSFSQDTSLTLTHSFTGCTKQESGWHRCKARLLMSSEFPRSSVSNCRLISSSTIFYNNPPPRNENKPIGGNTSAKRPLQQASLVRYAIFFSLPQPFLFSPPFYLLFLALCYRPLSCVTRYKAETRQFLASSLHDTDMTAVASNISSPPTFGFASHSSLSRDAFLSSLRAT